MRTGASLDFESLSEARLHVLRYQPSDTTSIPSSSHTRFYCIWWHKPNRVGYRANFKRYRWHWLDLLISSLQLFVCLLFGSPLVFVKTKASFHVFLLFHDVFTNKFLFCFLSFLLSHKAAYLNTEVSFKTSNNLLKRNNSSWVTFVQFVRPSGCSCMFPQTDMVIKKHFKVGN